MGERKNSTIQPPTHAHRPDIRKYVCCPGIFSASKSSSPAPSCPANQPAKEESNQMKKLYPVPGFHVKDLWATWGLSADAASTSTLTLYSVSRLKPGDSLKLQGYDNEGTFHSEYATIAAGGVDAANKQITLTGQIAHQYKSDSGKQGWIAMDIGGISGDPIFVNEGILTREGVVMVISHEIGHNNGLVHVDATSNLMTPKPITAGGESRALRYRKVYKYGTTTKISQWHEDVTRD